MHTLDAMQHLAVEQGEGWALVTISRSKVLNALNQELLTELDETLRWIEKQQDHIRCLIITGSGDKAFVAGADIGELRAISSAQHAECLASYGQGIFTRIESLGIPVIMAVNGYALGGGFELAMSGDFIFASEKAKFGQPEVNLGVMPGYGGTQRLTRLVGKNMASYLCISGEILDVIEAKNAGIVQKIFCDTELISSAKEFASQIAAKAPIAIRYIKKSIQKGLEIDLESALKLEAAYFGLTFDTKDRVEGMNAFIEKRRPQFKGN